MKSCKGAFSRGIARPVFLAKYPLRKSLETLDVGCRTMSDRDRINRAICGTGTCDKRARSEVPRFLSAICVRNVDSRDVRVRSEFSLFFVRDLRT